MNPDSRTGGGARPTLAETFLAIAAVLAERSTCPEGARHGAVLAVEGCIAATGYGSPAAGEAPCETCHLRDKFQLTGVKDWSVCPAVHAEANAVAFAARHGVGVRGATLYVTKEPCAPCRRLLKNAGVIGWVTQEGAGAI